MLSHFQYITRYFEQLLSLPAPTVPAYNDGTVALPALVVPWLSSFVQGHIDRVIAGTRSTLTYPLLHLHPLTLQPNDNGANYYSKTVTGAFTVWVLGKNDSQEAQDAAWAISEIWSDEILKKINHDTTNGIFESFTISTETIAYEQARPLWADRAYGWEVTFQLTLPNANDNLC